MNEFDKKHRRSITLIFTGISFLLFFVTMLIIDVAITLFMRAGILQTGQNDPESLGYYLMVIALLSIVLGSVLAAVFGRYFLIPINKMINAMNRLAAGDFKTRMSGKGRLARTPAGRELVESFNRMASQLEDTRILRSDFINNFSHEFKTPIVSIAGFAKLLRKGNLSREEELEYLEIIEDESLRLSSIATNVLNMTGIENQSILSDVSEYNLSEQLRSCVLLLERKWTRKKLEMNPDFGEHNIKASQELMRHVWLNILDNAVKFTPEYGEIEITVKEDGENVAVRIMNTGSTIPPDKQEDIFRKFYQADESHAAEGNGLGLAIVQKVVELHKGSVKVESAQGYTAFTVSLPK